MNLKTSSAVGFLAGALSLAAQIPVPSDAPPPLSPAQSAQKFRLAPGFRITLAASEPLIREPSGACWDEHGRFYVCELHGYNLEGQYDIDELNKTGQLDRVVRRIQANDAAKKAAEAGTFGTVKLLADTDGDGTMDRATVFADHLPPAYGICAARGGVIVACAPDIVYLADRDGDGQAEVREILFTGFNTGNLERGINAPQWGLDDWIYFGRGHGGGTITGPHLAKPVSLGGSNFRIKADGSAIEPVAGTTHTFGHATTAAGETFVVTTSRPGLYVTPLPWRYLARNPDVKSPATEQDAGNYSRVFPIAPPHPWRTKRAEDPGFFKYYRERYGASDSDPGGYFTSGCSPLVYQDVAFPQTYRGNYFMCEPAQNLVHRALIQSDGPALRLQRPPEEQASEFLSSADPWFHPMNLLHGPDGALYIVDLYREIIEDYSAIPRYLQQQYGLTNGIQHGRVWRLTHQDAPRAPAADMSRLNAEALAKETLGPHFWRRQTARRLLVERAEKSVAPFLAKEAGQARDAGAALNAYYTLQALGVLTAKDAAAALKHPAPEVRRHGLLLAESFLDADANLIGIALALAQSASTSVDHDALTFLQCALSLGESKDPRVVPALAALARNHGAMKWMPDAILSSVYGRTVPLLEALLDPAISPDAATSLLEPLCQSVAANRSDRDLTQSLIRIAASPQTDLQLQCLRGLKAGLGRAKDAALSSQGRQALQQLTSNKNAEVQRLALELVAAFQITDPAQLQALLTDASAKAADLKQPAAVRLAAVTQLASLDDARATAGLLAAWPTNTPQVREAILDAVFLRRDRLPALLDRLEQKSVASSALTAFQRITLVEHDNPDIRNRAQKLLAKSGGPNEALIKRFAAALPGKRDVAKGEQVFRDSCATCHQVRGIGFNVGPDLGAEFQRAEEAILKDILAPNDAITAGYTTYDVATIAGQSFNGLLTSESATSITLRQPVGLEQVLLKKDIARLTALPVSLMPEALAFTLEPEQVANVIAWLRDPGAVPEAKNLPNRVVLFDEEPEFLTKLNEGDGQAVLESSGAFAGRAFLVVSPPQKYSPRIAGWNFSVAEHPRPGEFRYMRLAWKSRGGRGVMIELADSGRWPDAKAQTRRYYAGANTTAWQAHQVSAQAPDQWRVVTLDLWKDNGAFTLTGIAPTAMGGPALFDRIELLRDLKDVE